MDAERLRRWHAVCRQRKESGYESLTPTERTWINVRALIDAIQNGGAIGYFYNYGADHVYECLADLEELDAKDVKVLVEQVCALFPKGVPAGIEARNAIIKGWSDSMDSTLNPIDTSLMPKMPALEEKLEAFLQVRGV